MSAAVSIVMPVYNAERHLRECLDSVLRQSFRDYEVICVDDGSTDGSPSILREYAGADARVRIVRRDHSNAGAARNAGFVASSGGSLLFLDADDIFAPRMLEHLVRGLDSTAADVAVCKYASFSDGRKKPSFSEAGFWRTIENPSSSVDIFRRWMGWSWDKLIRRSLIEKHDLRFQEIAASNDLAFVFSALSLADKVCETEAVLVAHRLHAGSIETQRDRTPLCGLEALRSYRSQMIAAGVFKQHPALECAFRAYVPRFLFWYLYTIANPVAYRLLKTEMALAAKEFGLVGSWAWWWRCLICAVKRPIRQFVRVRCGL